MVKGFEWFMKEQIRPLSDKSGGVFSEDNTLYERDITNASVGRY